MCTAKRLDALRALQHLRTLIYAFDRSLEGALAACGAPLVGYLAQHAFGFKVLCLPANGVMSMGQLTSSSDQSQHCSSRVVHRAQNAQT